MWGLVAIPFEHLKKTLQEGKEDIHSVPDQKGHGEGGNADTRCDVELADHQTAKALIRFEPGNQLELPDSQAVQRTRGGFEWSGSWMGFTALLAEEIGVEF